MIKIIGGRDKGRILKISGKINCRPTLSHVREALFNIIGNAVSSANILDAFAGTGSLGFEALSRSAERVIFVEKDLIILRSLKENSRSLGYESSAVIFRGNFFAVSKKIGQYFSPFDIIFADPPFEFELLSKFQEHILEKKLLNLNKGILVYEHFSKKFPETQLDQLLLFEKRSFGDVSLSFFSK